MIIPQLITRAVSNKHTSISGLVYLVAKFGAELLSQWWPTHAEQFKNSANIVEGFAVSYGLLMAGDSSKSVTKEEADTTFVRRADAPPQP